MEGGGAAMGRLFRWADGVARSDRADARWDGCANLLGSGTPAVPKWLFFVDLWESDFIGGEPLAALAYRMQD